VSIRFKVILPYLFLTLFIAVTGAYVVTRLVASSLEERLNNQLLEAGRVVSDSMAEQEIRQAGDARLIAFTRGFGEALGTGDVERGIELVKPAAGGANVESLTVFDAQGNEFIHFIKQSNSTILDVSQPGRASTLEMVNALLAENNPTASVAALVTLWTTVTIISRPSRLHSKTRWLALWLWELH
jgi:hypothetical protein